MVFICRHGETQWNAEGKLQGWKDSPITERGVQTAVNIGKFLDEHHGMECNLFSSDLGRAQQTSKIIAEVRTGIHVVVDQNLREICFGAHEGLTKTQRQEDQIFRDELERRERDMFHYRFTCAENYADGEKRVDTFFRGQDVTDADILVGHEAINRMIIKREAGLSEEESMRIIQPNDVMYMISEGRVSYKRIGDDSDFIEGIMEI